MPLFDYRCEKCQSIEEKLLPKVQPSVPCKVCGAVAKRMFSVGRGSRSGEGRTIWSRSMGINPDQIPEMKKRFPDDNYRPSDGAMEINGYKHQKKIAQRLGMGIW